MPRTGQSATICEVCKERVSHHGSNAGQSVGKKPNGANRVIHQYKPSCQKKWKENGEAIRAAWVENKDTPMERLAWPPSLRQWVLENVDPGAGRQSVIELFRAARVHPQANQWKMHDRSYTSFLHGVGNIRRKFIQVAPSTVSNGSKGNGNGNGHIAEASPPPPPSLPVHRAPVPASPEVIEAMIAAVPPLLRVLKEQGKTSTIETIFELVSAIEAPVGAGR